LVQVTTRVSQLPTLPKRRSAKAIATPKPMMRMIPAGPVGDGMTGIGGLVDVGGGVLVGVAVGVLVGVWVGVIVGVAVGVCVGVIVGVSVGVAVGVSVGVAVGVAVGVCVGVIVGVSVAVEVGVTVGVEVGGGPGAVSWRATAPITRFVPTQPMVLVPSTSMSKPAAPTANESPGMTS
jgi:hypothetical protein